MTFPSPNGSCFWILGSSSVAPQIMLLRCTSQGKRGGGARQSDDMSLKDYAATLMNYLWFISDSPAACGVLLQIAVSYPECCLALLQRSNTIPPTPHPHYRYIQCLVCWQMHVLVKTTTDQPDCFLWPWSRTGWVGWNNIHVYSDWCIKICTLTGVSLY